MNNGSEKQIIFTKWKGKILYKYKKIVKKSSIYNKRYSTDTKKRITWISLYNMFVHDRVGCNSSFLFHVVSLEIFMCKLYVSLLFHICYRLNPHSIHTNLIEKLFYNKQFSLFVYVRRTVLDDGCERATQSKEKL